MSGEIKPHKALRSVGQGCRDILIVLLMGALGIALGLLALRLYFEFPHGSWMPLQAPERLGRFVASQDIDGWFRTEIYASTADETLYVLVCEDDQCSKWSRRDALPSYYDEPCGGYACTFDGESPRVDKIPAAPGKVIDCCETSRYLILLDDGSVWVWSISLITMGPVLESYIAILVGLLFGLFVGVALVIIRSRAANAREKG